MENKQESYNVKNRSSSRVGYKIPEMNVRRDFQPGEIKKISYEELEKLSFQEGGLTLMRDYLQIIEEDVLQRLDIHTEPEYFMNEDQVYELLTTGTDDELRDCLDFAPVGVIDLVKDVAVRIPLNDFNKREIIKEKTGFNCDAAIRHIQEEKAATKEESKAPAAAPQRRTSGDKYKIVKK